MLLSIIVPAFNEEKILGKTLEKIKESLSAYEGEPIAWELIVCNNNSTDKTVEIASSLGAKVAFEPINQIARARNTGAQIAQGDWLLFIDADSYPLPELMAEAIEMMRHGDAVGCGATIVVEDGTLFNKLRMERLNPFFRFFRFCGGAFILCQREAFQEIGGFSTGLYAYEDIDFVFRLKSYGRKRGLKFIILHRYPVITSGRKGEYNFLSLATVFISNFAAVILFLLHFVLPKKLVEKCSSKILRYWYNGR